jgi:hypothetical protein
MYMACKIGGQQQEPAEGSVSGEGPSKLDRSSHHVHCGNGSGSSGDADGDEMKSTRGGTSVPEIFSKRRWRDTLP